MIAASQVAGPVSADVVQKCTIACIHCVRITGTSKNTTIPVSNGSYLDLVGS